MTQGNEIRLQKGIDYELLNDARLAKNLTFDDHEARTHVPKDTIKNMLNGKTKNPGVENLAPVCRELGVPIEKVLWQDEQKAIESQGIKEDNASVLALKEIYETQTATMKATSEAHIANIRAHYEQHIAEKNASFEKIEAHYEKRLADKREVIAELEKHLATLEKHLASAEKEKKWFRWGFVISIIVFAALCIAELAHPTKGWITW